MRIAYISPFYHPAICGVSRVVRELAERAAKDGHEVHVFCSDTDKYKRIENKGDVINGVNVHRCRYWFKVANFAYVWPSVFWKLLSSDVDVVHTHAFGHAHSFLGALAAKLKGVPHVHTTHCCWTDSFRSRLGRVMLNVVYPTFGRLTLKWSRHITAITPWEVSYIKKWGGKDGQIVVIPNGMDEMFFKEIKPNNFKEEQGIKGRMVLFFGRLNVTKGPDKFVTAAHEILKDRNNVEFVLVGPDEGMKEKVKELIGDEKKIHLLDPLQDRKKVVEMYQAADIFVLPSYREGLPLTLFEAMASGLPMVVSPVNGVPYEVEDGKNGLFVEYGNIMGLKDKIVRLLDNKGEARRMSELNKERARQYGWDGIYKRILGLYTNL